MINFTIKNIVTTQVVNGYKYFLTGDETSASINKKDEYYGLSAVIEESTAGDFFELYGEYNGVIYEDFITNYLNQLPYHNVVVFHDISVIEQIGTSFFITSQQTFLQSKDFGEPYKFRPIILHSSTATSYRIDYTMRIYNQYDNSQIIRQAQYGSFDVKKYGRRIRKINLGVEPVIAKVYNTLADSKPVVNLVNYNRMNITQDGGGSIQTQYVTSFADRNKISASVTAVKIAPAVQQQGDVLPTAPGQSMLSNDLPLSIEQISKTDKVYQQGEAPIGLTPFDNFYQFIIYNNAQSSAVGLGSPQLLDLTHVGTLYLNFFDQATGLKIKIPSYNNVKQINPVHGEVVFKIPSDQSMKILGLADKNYYISCVLPTGSDTSEETLLYSGTWYNAKNKADAVVSDSLDTLKTQYTTLQNYSTTTITAKDKTITEQKLTLDYQSQYIIALQNKVSELGGDVTAIQNTLSQSQDAVAQSQTNLAKAIAQNTSTKQDTITSEAMAGNVMGTTSKFVKINK
jgi:hypothetical protein